MEHLQTIIYIVYVCICWTMTWLKFMMCILLTLMSVDSKHPEDVEGRNNA